MKKLSSQSAARLYSIATMASKKSNFLLFDSKELISKLRPAFEEDVTEDNKTETAKLSEDLTQLNVSATTACSTCGVNFDSIEEQRAHFKLDWHRFNISNKLKGLKIVNEEQFEAQLDNISLSGSEDSDEDEDEIIAEKTLKHPKVFLTHTEHQGQVFSIHKAILPDFGKNSSLKWAIFSRTCF